MKKFNIVTMKWMIIAYNLISFDFNEAKTIILSIEFIENNNFNLS